MFSSVPSVVQPGVPQTEACGVCPYIGAKCVPVRGSQKGVPIAGDGLVCALWMLGIEDRVYVHRTDCHYGAHAWTACRECGQVVTIVSGDTPPSRRPCPISTRCAVSRIGLISCTSESGWSRKNSICYWPWYQACKRSVIGCVVCLSNLQRPRQAKGEPRRLPIKAGTSTGGL